MPPAAPAPAGTAAAQPAGTAEGSLAERRRAARAAQAAVQSQTSTPDGNPIPSPAPAAAAPNPAAAPAAAPAPGAAADPRWAEVYRSYQQRSPNPTAPQRWACARAITGKCNDNADPHLFRQGSHALPLLWPARRSPARLRAAGRNALKAAEDNPNDIARACGCRGRALQPGCRTGTKCDFQGHRCPCHGSAA